MAKRTTINPLFLTLSYAALAASWIIVTDLLADWLAPSTGVLAIVEGAKGLLFVVFTSAVLYVWARRCQTGTDTETEALAQARLRVEHSRRMYATLSEVNRRIIRPTNRVVLSQAICDALIDPGGFGCAWIGRASAAGDHMTIIAHAGATPPRQFSIGADADADGQRIADVLRRGQPACNSAEGEQGGCLGTMKNATGARACVSIPFQQRGSEPMVLSVCSHDPELFSTDTMRLLTELAADLEFGLESIAEREARAAAEVALRASEERYRVVAENSQDVIWIMSPDATFQYVSPSVERLLGYAPAKALTMRLGDILTPASLAKAEHELALAREELNTAGQIRSRLMELELMRADGTTVWAEVNTAEFYDGGGRVTGILGVSRDVTQRRATKQALASEVARCRALLDVSVDAIQVTDLDGHLLDANEIFLRERGFTREMIPSLRIENWNAELTPAQIRSRLANATAEPQLFETVHRRADGTLFSVEGRAKRVEVDGRAMVYTTTRDITERRELEQRFLRAQRLESVGLIASGIAHDLNNVLTPILLSTGLLEMRYTSPEDEALLKPIEAAARRGSSIVQQILTFARGAEGQRVAIEPKILLKELTNLMRETFPRNIVHKLEIARDAWPLCGDPTQLHQVFLNLAVNARDAMPSGGTLTLTVHNRQLGAEEAKLIPSVHSGNYVCIAISDTGTGMTPDVIDHLFEPFFSTKPRGRGTGLGLSTVHGLVRSHGGFVEVDSRLGHGSEFRVYLPAALETAKAPAAAEPSPQRLPGHGEQVLIADDEPAILSVLASVLRRNGFLPLTASDGHEALALLKSRGNKIAIVVTDVMMPKFDGVRLAAAVRMSYPTIPVIAMSGMIAPTDDDDSRKQLRELGVTTVLDKPYGEIELLKAIDTALRTQTLVPK